MRRFEKKHLDSRDYKSTVIAVTICRVLLTPILVWYRIYLWVWDGTIGKDSE